MKQKIIDKLTKTEIEILEIENFSEQHRSHLNLNFTDSQQTPLETHFKIKITGKGLEGKTLLQKHKFVNKLLEEEFKGGLHALVISFT